MVSSSVDRESFRVVFLQPLQVFIAVLVEHVRKQQEMVIEYLQLENQVLREKLAGKRVVRRGSNSSRDIPRAA
jgi:hypothetical protein